MSGLRSFPLTVSASQLSTFKCLDRFPAATRSQLSIGREELLDPRTEQFLRLSDVVLALPEGGKKVAANQHESSPERAVEA